MGRLLHPVALAILAGALGCDPGGPVPDAAAPTDAAADGPSDAGSLDAAVAIDGAQGVDAAGDSGDAALATDASQGEEDGGVLSVECEQADDSAIPTDPAGVVTGAGAAARQGGFVVAWTVVDGIESFIRARLLDDCGVPEGDDIAVDISGLVVGVPVVAAVGGTDDFVIAWSREDVDGDGAGVVFQRFGPDGSAAGVEAVANEVTFDDQIATSAAALPAGFVVAWEDYSGAVLVRPDALLSTFDETGRPMSGEIGISARPDGPQNLPLVATASNGALLAAWSGDGVAMGRRRDEGGWTDADGIALSDEPALASGVAAGDDGFAVALQSDADDAEGDVVLSLVDPAAGGAALVTIAARTGAERDPVVVRRAEGLLIAWTDETYRDDPRAIDSSGTTVMAAWTDEVGLIGEEPFVVPTTTEFDQELQAGAVGPSGVLLVWLDRSRADGEDGGGLRGRLVIQVDGQ
ncbi:MAG: hypothetical protein HYY06_17335 [Deltaproteobacteria bacterium]|nr:hypothetical protein [Deltaproteobacteria bacterium]